MIQIVATLHTLSAQVTDLLTGRVDKMRADREAGNSAVETAVIVGVCCVAAIGVGALITAAVQKYGAAIK